MHCNNAITLESNAKVTFGKTMTGVVELREVGFNISGIWTWNICHSATSFTSLYEHWKLFKLKYNTCSPYNKPNCENVQENGQFFYKQEREINFWYFSLMMLNSDSNLECKTWTNTGTNHRLLPSTPKYQNINIIYCAFKKHKNNWTNQ